MADDLELLSIAEQPEPDTLQAVSFQETINQLPGKLTRQTLQRFTDSIMSHLQRFGQESEAVFRMLDQVISESPAFCDQMNDAIQKSSLQELLGNTKVDNLCA